MEQGDYKQLMDKKGLYQLACRQDGLKEEREMKRKPLELFAVPLSTVGTHKKRNIMVKNI